jgi:methyl coenzyme M reductase beta subunit
MIKAAINTYAPVGQNILFIVKINDDNGNTHDRVVPLLSKNLYAAQLLAIKYICEAIENKDTKIQITIPMPYIVSALQKSSVGTEAIQKKKRTRSTNVDLIDEVRTLLDKFKSFILVFDNNEQLKTAAKCYSSI